MRYDAILIDPLADRKAANEVIPFLENVLRGRNVPRERMLEVAGALLPFRRAESDQPAVPRADCRPRRAR